MGYYVPLQLQWPVQQHTTTTKTPATTVFQPLTTSTPTAMLLEAASSSSDYFSDSASSGGWSSDDEAADRSSSCSLEPASCDASYAFISQPRRAGTGRRTPRWSWTRSLTTWCCPSSVIKLRCILSFFYDLHPWIIIFHNLYTSNLNIKSIKYVCIKICINKAIL